MAIRDIYSAPKNRRPTPGDSYNAALQTQGRDYDRIMQGYIDLPNTGKINPVLGEYNFFESPEELAIKNQLSEFSRTGGYSDSDIYNIRERSTSPIRAIYANAQRNAKRAVRLSGGYSPNAGAVQSKLARESSNQIGEATTRLNADLAENIRRGKLEAIDRLTPLANRESNYRMGIDESNLNEMRRIGQLNSQLPQLSLAGQSSIYSTTPALVNLFGQQVLQERGQDIQQEISNPRRRSSGIAARSFSGR